MKQCNKSNELCGDDQCITKEELPLYVEIEVEGINVTDLNMTEVKTTISDLTEIEEDKLRIQFDINDNDEIIRIIVIVDDEETAEKISISINTVIDEGLCTSNSSSEKA